MRTIAAFGVFAFLAGGAAAADVEPRLTEAIRLEVERQLRGEAPAARSTGDAVAGVDVDLLRRLVSEELARQRAAPAAGSTSPQFAREFAGEDWYYLQGEDDSPPIGEMTARERYYRSEEAAPRRALAGVAGAVTADNPVRPSNDAFEFISTTSGTVATITLSADEVPVGNPDGPRIDTTSWSLTATAPIDKETEEASFASLAGLANGFNLGTAWKFSSVPRSKDTATSNWARIFAVEANVGYDDFAYFSSLTSKEKDREMRWSLGASYGTSSPSRGFYFGGGFDLQHRYKSQDKRIVCPLSTEETFDCVQGSFGPPSSGYDRTAYLEARWSVLARPVSLRITHDIEDDTTSADLPVYLLRNKDGKFTGGLRFGWLSEESDFIIGVFVGKEFGAP